ncbi:MAG: hypothetical protein JWM86_783 [Thermoleophilia bacterium]|nr:hypothetical protein [Thermoleophilia bacterium]
MDGSRFVIRHVDVSIAAVDTIWRWRGWASSDDNDRLRDHRTLDVYLDGGAEAQRIAGFHEPLSAGLQQALGKVEWAVAETVAGAQEAWRPTLGALRSARRGQFRPRVVPGSKHRATDLRHGSTRRAQPVRLNRILADVTNVWEGATVRMVITRSRVELQVRSPGTFEVGDLPGSIQKALRYGAEATRHEAQLQLAAASRVLAGRVPSYGLAREIESEYDERYGFIDRPAPGGIEAWEHEPRGLYAGAPDPGAPLDVS